jgi:hypothetical protein
MDESDERFSKLEEQVANISYNMAIVMATLENKFGMFWEFGSCNSEAGLDDKFGDNEPIKGVEKRVRERETKFQLLEYRRWCARFTIDDTFVTQP